NLTLRTACASGSTSHNSRHLWPERDRPSSIPPMPAKNPIVESGAACAAVARAPRARDLSPWRLGPLPPPEALLPRPLALLLISSFQPSSFLSSYLLAVVGRPRASGRCIPFCESAVRAAVGRPRQR